MTRRREFNRRELRALAIVAKSDMIRKVDESTYLVMSPSWIGGTGVDKEAVSMSMLFSFWLGFAREQLG